MKIFKSKILYFLK